MCASCCETTKTLHVHHMSYSNNPWEVDDNNLVTLCEDCHDLYHHILSLNYDIAHIWLVIKMWSEWEYKNYSDWIKKHRNNG